MERQHRRRTLTGRILDWYHGPQRLSRFDRQSHMANRDEASSNRHERRACPDAWNPTEQCNHLCKAVGYCVTTGRQRKRNTR